MNSILFGVVLVSALARTAAGKGCDQGEVVSCLDTYKNTMRRNSQLYQNLNEHCNVLQSYADCILTVACTGSMPEELENHVLKQADYKCQLSLVGRRGVAGIPTAGAAGLSSTSVFVTFFLAVFSFIFARRISFD